VSRARDSVEKVGVRVRQTDCDRLRDGYEGDRLEGFSDIHLATWVWDLLVCIRFVWLFFGLDCS
jgi:hypothetical protein